MGFSVVDGAGAGAGESDHDHDIWNVPTSSDWTISLGAPAKEGVD